MSINGKEGTRAAEVRDMNVNRYKPVPEFKDPENGDIIAKSDQEKLIVWDWYHRFDSLPQLPDNTGYDTNEITGTNDSCSLMKNGTI